MRLLPLFLAQLLLLGSVGVTVNRHFCQGELKAIALFGEAEKCHREQARTHCPFHPPAAEVEEDGKKGCCDDESQRYQIEDEQPAAGQGFYVGVLSASVSPAPLFSYQPPHPRPRLNTNFENYRPPPLIPDVRRRFQVYRI